MAVEFEKVIVVGGGTAGWLTACYLAALRPELDITLVEAPDVPTIGVGEGSWPTLRETLRRIGIREEDFLRECDASFKQGSRFDGWRTGDDGDSYLHPFTPPQISDIAAAARTAAGRVPFDAAVCTQTAVCARDLAPRQRAMPEYAGALNYGYHLDAAKLGAMLARHGTAKLGIRHLRDRVTAVRGTPDRIDGLDLRDSGYLPGDLFVDCSGMAGLLIAGHCGVPWTDRSATSFNDRALAVQVPVAPDSAIASQTIGTAHDAGWLWDIALPTRRGIGCVYSSRHMDDDAALATLRAYVSRAIPGTDPESLAPRRLTFATGHRERFWQGNCLAIGLSAGFIEPLEASAIVLVELSVRYLVENYPRSTDALPAIASRFNTLFRYRWDRIIDFLKLHYVLSERDGAYWRDQRDPATIPASLAEQLLVWRQQIPSRWDFPHSEEIFSPESQQFVLYGMGFAPPGGANSPAEAARVDRAIAEIREKARSLVAALPANRDYLNALAPRQASATETMERQTQ